MSARLTKSMREEIAHAVYAASDLPKRTEALEREISESVTAYFESQIPAKFAEFSKENPREWFNAISSISTSLGYVSLLREVPIPAHWAYYSSEYRAVKDRLDAHISANLQPLQNLLDEDVRKLRESVTGALAACRTIKAVRERYPELAPYLPADCAHHALAVLPSTLANVLTQANVPLPEAA